MTRHIVQWTAPSPLWSELTRPNGTPNGAHATFGIPAILRFATDSFVQDYLDVLATDPLKLGEFRAVPETWRGRHPQPAVPAPEPAFRLPFQRLGNTRLRPATTGAKPQPATNAALPRLKLYQPAHQRFYLVSACLVCQSPGLPDRRVDAGQQERVSFVVRRLFPPNATAESSDPQGWDEYAWVDGAWVKVVAEDRPSPQSLVPREERLPLFPASFSQDDQRTRRLFSGVIPVARRDAYLGATRRSAAAAPAQPPGTSTKTSRKILFRTLVAEPWKNLLIQAEKTRLAVTEVVDGESLSPTQITTAFRVAREQTQSLSWLVLLDFAKFLRQYLPDVADVVDASGTGNSLPTQAMRDLVTALNGTVLTSATLTTALTTGSTITTVASSLADALRRVTPFEADLESVTASYQRDTASTLYPNFLFPLADAEIPTGAPLPPVLTFSPPLTATEQNDLLIDLDPAANDPLERIDKLTVLLVRALPDTTDQPQPEIPTAAIPPVDNTNGVFRLRCLYERPACGPLHPDVVSDPTEPVELAGYFDPDAPTRPIRIGLPIDTSPAGLRKFDKNTAFVMSDILCGQVAKLKGLTLGDLIRSVLPWPLHKDLSLGDMGPCGGANGFGTICSLSIPIITICALILLLVMVTLLDLIFRWMPFLMICFPVPGLKGKK